MGSTEPDGGQLGPRAGARMSGSVTAEAGELPGWATLVRADNPGPMTLSGTNSWILRGPGAEVSVVVDPGPDDPAHLRRLADTGPVAAILVTHGHSDHVAGLARFRELTGAPVRDLGDGEVVDVAGLRIEGLATPGHTADSRSYLVSGGGGPAVLTGDTVLGAGTTVVAWPDGDLGRYLASLERLSGLGPLPVLPGHGPPLADCAAAAAGYLAHRRARLDQVRAALAAGATGVGDVLDRVYPGLEPALRAAAELTVRAQLAYLEGDREHNTGPAWLDRT